MDKEVFLTMLRNSSYWPGLLEKAMYQARLVQKSVRMMNKTHKTIDFRLKDTDNSTLRKEANPGQKFSKIERMVNEFEKYGPPEGKDFETAQREVFFRGVDTSITMEQNRHVSQDTQLTFLHRAQLSVGSQDTESQ